MLKSIVMRVLQVFLSWAARRRMLPPFYLNFFRRDG